MYRNTNNEKNDLSAICTIYNDITNSDRTVELHQWEWFTSPYENKSYVVLDKDEKILGHHGILTIKINYKNAIYNTGKTENTIMKKGYGPLYFKNEMAMHKEYINDYDILITTAAHGVTKKIREKLGYKVFANYVIFKRIVDFRFFTFRFKNLLINKIVNFFIPFLNIFIFKSKVSNIYQEVFKLIDENDLIDIETFYNKIKDNFQFSQIRSKEFLVYRLVNNPYNEYSILKLYRGNDLCGYVIYTVRDNRISIEDMIFENEIVSKELLNRLFNHIKTNKIAYTIILTTLKNSLLDKKYNYFFRRTQDSVNSNKLMIKNNIKDENKKHLTVESFYFTKLMMEGIS